MNSAYETDFFGWTKKQAEYLKKGNFEGLDMQNLIEEIESMGASQENKLESHLLVLLMHLLKWKYQTYMRTRSWKLSIQNARYQIGRVLNKNPSLKHKINERTNEVYTSARYLAAEETNLEIEIFPQENPWSFEQIMQEEFLP